MTSVLRLHDATNANLWTKHDVAKQAANEMALKEIDKFFFEQRISLPMATLAARRLKLTSGTWPRDVCASRIVVKATCSAFQPELEILEKTGRLHALRVETCPIKGQKTSLGIT